MTSSSPSNNCLSYTSLKLDSSLLIKQRDKSSTYSECSHHGAAHAAFEQISKAATLPSLQIPIELSTAYTTIDNKERRGNTAHKNDS